MKSLNELVVPTVWGSLMMLQAGARVSLKELPSVACSLVSQQHLLNPGTGKRLSPYAIVRLRGVRRHADVRLFL